MGPTTETTALMDAYIEYQKPMYHTPVDLGITAFKRELKDTGASKRLIGKLVRAFKKRAWAEYHAVARDRGTFPTHRDTAKTIEVATTETESIGIKVNGTNKK